MESEMGARGRSGNLDDIGSNERLLNGCAKGIGATNGACSNAVNVDVGVLVHAAQHTLVHHNDRLAVKCAGAGIRNPHLEGGDAAVYRNAEHLPTQPDLLAAKRFGVNDQIPHIDSLVFLARIQGQCWRRGAAGRQRYCWRGGDGRRIGDRRGVGGRGGPVRRRRLGSGRRRRRLWRVGWVGRDAGGCSDRLRRWSAVHQPQAAEESSQEGQPRHRQHPGNQLYVETQPAFRLGAELAGRGWARRDRLPKVAAAVTALDGLSTNLFRAIGAFFGCGGIVHWSRLPAGAIRKSVRRWLIRKAAMIYPQLEASLAGLASLLWLVVRFLLPDYKLVLKACHSKY